MRIASSCTELTFFLLSVLMPSLTIIGSPVDEGFHTGLLLTLTGWAEFNPAVDTSLTVNGMWTKINPFSNLTADSRVSIRGPRQAQERPMMVYETSLIVDTLNMRRGDSGDYTVRLDISSLPFTTRITVSLTRNIVVLGNDTSYCTFIKSVGYLICHCVQTFLLSESVSLLWKWVCPLLVTCTLWNVISVVQLPYPTPPCWRWCGWTPIIEPSPLTPTSPLWETPAPQPPYSPVNSPSLT